MDGRATAIFRGNALQTSAQQGRMRAAMRSTILETWENADTRKDRNLFHEFVTTRYLPYARMRKRSWKLDNRLIEQYLYPRCRNRPLDSVDASDVLARQEHMLKKAFPILPAIGRTPCSRACSTAPSAENFSLKEKIPAET